MTLKAAVVGGGVVSGAHLPGLKRNPLVDLVAICDIDEGRAKKAAREYGIKAYLDMDEMLRREALDWIHVCTPVQTHRDLALKAIGAGAHVLIEKPATVTVEELEEIEVAAEKGGVAVSAVRNHLFTPTVTEARDRIEAGELGHIRGIDVIFTGNTKPDEPNRGSWTFDLPGGEFEEGIPHPIYLGLALGGVPRDADAVSATTIRYGSYEGEFTYDGLGLQWKTGDEGLCSIRTMAGSIPQRFAVVHGEERSLTVDLVSQTTIDLDRNYITSPKARALNNVDHALGRVRGTLANTYGVAQRRFASSWEREKYWNAHYRQYDLEARALLAGDEPPVPFENVKWTVELIEQVRERASADAGAGQNRPDVAASGVEADDDD